VISHITERFRAQLQELPATVRRQARTAYRRFKENPYHPSLRFRQVHPTQPIYSVRINREYRALGVRDGEVIIWFWIGSHAAYDRLLDEL
jgi:hypothetical protein